MSGWREALGRFRSAREVVYGLNRRNVELVYAHNARGDYPIADDKLRAKQILREAGVPVAEDLAVCEGLFDVPRVLSVLRAHGDFVIKPSRGGGGEGIVVVEERRGHHWITAGGRQLDEQDLRRHLAEILFGRFARGELEDRAMVERRVRPHPVFAELWAHGLSDIRVITLRGTPRLAMVRVPTARSGGKANLHQGGLGLAVELETGRVTRAMAHGRTIARHPDSNVPLLGVAMPQWDVVLGVARLAAVSVPLGYLGVDIVVDAAKGPLVLEINARPGLEIQNVCGVPLGEVV